MRGRRTPKPRGGGFRAVPDLTIYGHRAHRTNRKWVALPPSQSRREQAGQRRRVRPEILGYAWAPPPTPPHTQPPQVLSKHCPDQWPPYITNGETEVSTPRGRRSLAWSTTVGGRGLALDTPPSLPSRGRGSFTKLQGNSFSRAWRIRGGVTSRAARLPPGSLHWAGVLAGPSFPVGVPRPVRARKWVARRLLGGSCRKWREADRSSEVRQKSEVSVRGGEWLGSILRPTGLWRY